MVLSDPQYLTLLIPCSLLCFLLPAGHARSLFVLACSYGYYLTFPSLFLPVLLGITTIAYVGGLLIERCSESRWQNWVMTAAIVVCFVPLITYKYLIPLGLAKTSGGGAHWDLTAAQIVAPVGLSFYSFAAVGYLADVALGMNAAVRNPIRMGLFCGFFPYVTAGPIPRTATVMPQLNFDQRFDAAQAMRGVSEVLIGSVMKLLIADSLSGPSAAVYADLVNSTPLEKFVATVFFGFQLYADFAGYSLIAIGSARLFGIAIPPNFRQPFLARTITEFWRCWHISLFTWLRDYVFTPLRLQWRRHPQMGTSAAIFITLVLVGIWHGAGWGFVVFGIAHGVLMIVSMLTLTRRDRFWAKYGVPLVIVDLIRIPITFVLVSLTLVLIRAQGLSEALSIYRKMFSRRMLYDIATLFRSTSTDPFKHIHLHQNATEITLVCVLIGGDMFVRWGKVPFLRLPVLARASVYGLCVLVILYQVIAVNVTKPFVYFQF